MNADEYDLWTVYKYPLKNESVQVVHMPADAEILAVAVQNGRPTLWARVQPGRVHVDHRITIVGTGHAAPPAGQAKYIGTVFEGPFVWHVFDGGVK